MKTITIKAKDIYEVNKELTKLEREYKIVEVLSSATVDNREIVRVKCYNSKPKFTY